ncbi:MAG TPA: response regulator [Thermoanaerobaculia bacterium]|nr:response regulator [Thermoanaerobaculia bacterium]
MVLLIDDDPSVRSLLAALMTRDGLAHESAADGVEAIEWLRRRDFDAIILDLLLPERNGFEVLQFLKAERPHLLPRVVVITAASESTLKHFDDRKRVAAVLRKPFDIAVLSEAVKRARPARSDGGMPL